MTKRRVTKRIGRPPGRDPVPADKAEAIIRGLDAGRTLTSLCAEIGRDMSTVTLWKQKDAAFAKEFARARLAGATAMADEAQDIADEATPENVQVAKLRADLRLKRAACFCPTVFGSKVAMDHSGTMTLEQLVAGVKPPEPE